MISLDTTVILAALNPGDGQHALAIVQLTRHGQRKPLFVSPVVHAELLASNRTSAALAFLKAARIAVAWDMPPAVWELAGKAYGDYLSFRNYGKELPGSLLADFLIAAHADYHQMQVLTLDRTIYDFMFPNLLADT